MNTRKIARESASEAVELCLISASEYGEFMEYIEDLAEEADLKELKSMEGSLLRYFAEQFNEQA